MSSEIAEARLRRALALEVGRLIETGRLERALEVLRFAHHDWTRQDGRINDRRTQ